MGMPHSNDLRLRVLAAVDDGVPVRQVVALLRVSVSYIYKALIRRRRTGETAARMPCGRPPRKLAGHEQALLTRLGAEPDATLAELHDWLTGERGVTVSLGCLWRTLDRLGLRLKKVASCRRAEPARRGGGPRGLVGQPGALNPVRLIFLDETWIATNMMRRYGRSPRGERLVGAVPYGHWKTTTFVVGPRCDGLTASFVIDGPINGEWFRAYVEKVLAPTLRPGDIVILDNLGAHKVAGVRAAGPSRRAAPGCSTCRPIRQTSTRSSSSSPSSRRSCARPPPELSRPSGQPSPPCAPPSAPMNAQITSPPQVIDAHRESALVYRFLCIPARRPTRTVAGSRRGLSAACSAADIKLAFAAFDPIPISTGGGPNGGMDAPPPSDQS